MDQSGSTLRDVFLGQLPSYQSAVSETEEHAPHPDPDLIKSPILSKKTSPVTFLAGETIKPSSTLEVVHENSHIFL